MQIPTHTIWGGEISGFCWECFSCFNSEERKILQPNVDACSVFYWIFCQKNYFFPSFNVFHTRNKCLLSLPLGASYSITVEGSIIVIVVAFVSSPNTSIVLWLSFFPKPEQCLKKPEWSISEHSLLFSLSVFYRVSNKSNIKQIFRRLVLLCGISISSNKRTYDSWTDNEKDSLYFVVSESFNWPSVAKRGHSNTW